MLSYHSLSPQSQHLPCRLSLKSSPSQSVSLSFIRSVWVRSKKSQPSEISNVSDLGVTGPGCFPEASGSLRFAQLLSCPPGLGCQSPGESPRAPGGGRFCLVWGLGVPPCSFRSGCPMACFSRISATGAEVRQSLRLTDCFSLTATHTFSLID